MLNRVLRINMLWPSGLVLAAANLVPLVGVLRFGWDAFALVLLYWLENIVIGFFNVLRLQAARGDGADSAARRIPAALIFLVHFGLFTLVHGLVLFAVFAGSTGVSGPAPGALPAHVFRLVHTLQLGWPLLALFVSHGVSFVFNTMMAGEYRHLKLRTLMTRPYQRIAVMHVAVLAGAFLAQLSGSGTGVLVILVGLKLVSDWRAHLAERHLAERHLAERHLAERHLPHREGGYS